MTHPPAQLHDPIEEFAPDLFLVRGSIRMNRLMRITRNMGIIRHAGELSLVNAMRLTADGERALCGLGDVKQILRLGPFHGIDDPYYVETFGAELWTPGPSETYPEPKPAVVMDATTVLPFPDAEVFGFDGSIQPEVALRVRREGGVLFTADAIQHYGDYRHNNWLARTVMPFVGFPRTTVVGPLWLKAMTPPGGSLEPAFRRLLERDFEQLLSAHGSPLRQGARASVEAAVDRAAFGG